MRMCRSAIKTYSVLLLLMMSLPAYLEAAPRPQSVLRFLAVDVLAATTRFNHHQRVPMVRRSDMDRVDIRARQHFPKIVVGLYSVMQKPQVKPHRL